MTEEFKHLSLPLIEPSLTNPRKSFNETKLQELAASIKASGVHQPILVRPLPASRVADTSIDTSTGKPRKTRPAYELVCGERRYRASVLAGVDNIPAMIRELTDDQVRKIQIVENLQRDDLTELEEAEGYEALMTMDGLNADQVGAEIGKSRSYVYTRLKLLDLSPECKQAMREGKIDSSRGLLIARIPDSKLQLKALTHATTMQGYPADLPSVRSLQNWLRDNVMLKLEHAIFSITDSRLVKEAGNCTNCPKRTGANPDLFVDVDSADICTDPACFHGKEEAHRAQLRKKAESKGMRIVEGKEALELLDGVQYRSVPFDYDDLSKKRPDLGKEGDNVKTLGEILGQDAPDPILFIHPRTQQMMELVPSDKADAVLLTKGIASQEAPAHETPGSTDYAGQLESLQKRLTQKSESLLHRGLFTACTDGLRSLDDKASLKLLCTGDLLRAIMLTKLDGYEHDEETLAMALGYTFADGEDEQDGLAMHIRATTTANLCRALIICELQADYHTSADSAPLILPALVKELALDTRAVVKEAKATAKAEFADRIKELQTKIDAQKAPTAADPAARPKEGAGGSKGKGVATKKIAPARAPKLSAEEATQGIADALQGIEGASSAPEGAVATPAKPAGEGLLPTAAEAAAIRASLFPSIPVGQRIKVLTGKYKGKEGAIVEDMGEDCYRVKVDRVSTMTGLRTAQMEVLEGATA